MHFKCELLTVRNVNRDGNRKMERIYHLIREADEQYSNDDMKQASQKAWEAVGLLLESGRRIQGLAK